MIYGKNSLTPAACGLFRYQRSPCYVVSSDVKTEAWNLAGSLSGSSTCLPWLMITSGLGYEQRHFTNSNKHKLSGEHFQDAETDHRTPGERAVLDGTEGGRRTTLTARGAWTWYWGFEITNTRPGRSIQNDRRDSPRPPRLSPASVIQKVRLQQIHTTRKPRVKFSIS